MQHTDRLRITTGSGTANPVHASDLLPEALDNVLGATDARLAWTAANEAGRAAARALAAARREWVASHPERDYGDFDAYLAARDVELRPLEREVDDLTPKSRAALVNYDEAQQRGYASSRGAFASRWLAADARALEALSVLDEAIAEREALQRYVAAPDRSDRPGTGHWSRSITLREKGLAAEPQRRDIAIVVRSAPRELVRAMTKGATK